MESGNLVLGNMSNILLSSSQELTKSIFSSLMELLKPILAILGGLLGLYIIFLIIKFILNRIDSKRLKRIDENIQTILKRLDSLEEKMSLKKEKKKSH